MKGKTHDLNHYLTFYAHTFNCVCHSIRSMFRVLGIYNFDLGLKPHVCNLCHEGFGELNKLNRHKQLYHSKGRKISITILPNMNESIYLILPQQIQIYGPSEFWTSIRDFLKVKKCLIFFKWSIRVFKTRQMFTYVCFFGIIQGTGKYL